MPRGPGGYVFGMPTNSSRDELPGTLKRSPDKAQRTWLETHDSAVESYGEGERAHRTAFASLKHSFEKVDDRWEPKKDGHKGPSDSQAAKTGAEAREGGETAGGVDVRGHTKKELMDRARKLDVRGRSKMTKEELGRAIARKQD